jgi:hypothetical protein
MGERLDETLFQMGRSSLRYYYSQYMKVPTLQEKKLLTADLCNRLLEAISIRR